MLFSLLKIVYLECRIKSKAISRFEGFLNWQKVTVSLLRSSDIQSSAISKLFATYIETNDRHNFKSLKFSYSGILDLRPQCAMVLAHMAQISKLYSLLDAKDQQLVNNTVQLVSIVGYKRNG